MSLLLAFEGQVQRAPLVTRVTLPAITAALLFTPPNLLTSTLAPQPFKNTDFPTPQAVVRQAPFVAQNLLLTTLAVPAQAPFGQSDWPNPRARPLAQQGDAWQNPIALQTVPVTSWIFENPRAAPRANLGFTKQPQLEAAAQDPFRQTDWPNPRLESLRISTVHARPDVDPTPVAQPLTQAEWRNPDRPRRSVELLTWVQSPAVPPVVVGAPFVPPVPELPRRRAFELDAQPLGGVLVDLTPVQAFDWPLPARRVAQQPAAPVNLLVTTLAVVQGSPFTPVIFENPRAAQRRPELLTWLQSPAVPAPSATLPFQNELPIAQRRGFELDAQILGGVLVDLGTPFAQLDWPNPPLQRARVREGWALNLLEGTLSLPIGPAPFRPMEMPVPLRVQFPSSLRTFASFSPIDFYPPVAPTDYVWIHIARRRGRR